MPPVRTDFHQDFAEILIRLTFEMEKDMKSKISFSITLTLSLLLSLVSLPSKAQAAPPPRFKADLGVVTLSATQTLRVTVAGTSENEMIRVRFRSIQYGIPVCSGMPAVCRHTVATEGATPVATLGADDTLSFDVPGTGGVRVVVECSSAKVRVLGIVFDTSTQRVMAIYETEMLSMS